MYAVIRSGGKQHKVAEGDVIVVERLTGDVGATITFEQVLAVSDDGKLIAEKTALVGVVVTGTILEQFKADKVIAFKFKKRKGYARTKGHRQDMTRLEIEAIEIPGRVRKPKPAKEEVKAKAPAKKAPGKAAAKKRAVKAAPAAKPAATEKPVAKPAAKKPTAKKPAAKKPTATKPVADEAAKEAAEAKVPAKKAPAKKSPAKPAPATKVPAKKAPGKKTARPPKSGE